MKNVIIFEKPSTVWVIPENLDTGWINGEFYKPLFLEIESYFERDNIEVKKFSKIADIRRVTGFEVEKYLEITAEGHPYLRVKNVKEFFIDYEDMQHIPHWVHRKFENSQFKQGDIALTITGRVGTAAIISNDKLEHNACQDVVKVSIKDKANIDTYYLLSYLNSKFNYHLLNRFNSGGSRPRTLINNVRKVKIPSPSPEIQKYIGDKVRKAEKLREEYKKFMTESKSEVLKIIDSTEGKPKRKSCYKNLLDRPNIT